VDEVNFEVVLGLIADVLGYLEQLVVTFALLGGEDEPVGLNACYHLI
jgi:hypothetical protein